MFLTARGDQCSEDLGIFTSGCDASVCNKDCIRKFPRRKGVSGFCYSISPFVSCRCLYEC